jgi:hypothetical protein
MIRFSPLIDMGVDAYNAFEHHKKVYESAMEDLLAGESYTLTKINAIANNLQQQINDLCNNHWHLPQMAIGTQQHHLAAMGQRTRNTTSTMDIRTHRDIPNTGPHANQELPPFAQSSGTIPRPPPFVSPVNQSTPQALNHLIQDVSPAITCWHGGGHPEYALDGINELSNDDLTSLGLDDKYYDTVLKSHEQIMSSTPHPKDRMDDCCFDDMSATQALLKHPAWDHLIDTSPKFGWSFINIPAATPCHFLSPWFHLKALICRVPQKGTWTLPLQPGHLQVLFYGSCTLCNIADFDATGGYIH